MFSLLLLPITVPLAIAGQDYQYAKEFLDKESESPQDGAFCCDKTKNLIINGNFEYANTYDWVFGRSFMSAFIEHSPCTAGRRRCIADHSWCETSYYHKHKQYLAVVGITWAPPDSTSVIWHQKIENLKTGKWYRFCANFKTIDAFPAVTVELSTGESRTVTIDTDEGDECDWQQISFCFYVGSRVSVNIMLEESSLEFDSILAIDDVSVQELVDPQLTMTLELLSDKTVEGTMGTMSTEDGTLPEQFGGLYYWFVLTLQSQSGGKFTVNWSAPRGWGNSTGSIRANRYAVGPPWASNPSASMITSFPGFVFLSNTVYAIGMVATPCCEGCIANGWTYHVVYPTFFRFENWYSGALGKGTYTSNYGLTETDRTYVEQWVGTYEP